MEFPRPDNLKDRVTKATDIAYKYPYFALLFNIIGAHEEALAKGIKLTFSDEVQIQQKIKWDHVHELLILFVVTQESIGKKYNFNFTSTDNNGIIFTANMRTSPHLREIIVELGTKEPMFSTMSTSNEDMCISEIKELMKKTENQKPNLN